MIPITNRIAAGLSIAEPGHIADHSSIEPLASCRGRRSFSRARASSILGLLMIDGWPKLPSVSRTA
jgi:hypothetical protein